MTVQKRRRGRPPVDRLDWNLRVNAAQMIHTGHRADIADDRAAGVAKTDGTPTEIAYERTAIDMGVSVDTARDAVLARRRRPPGNRG